jgi:hypothetical protein
MDVYFNFARPDATWIEMLSALGVPTALVIAAGNAWWQARLQERQLKLDMFEKRFAIYLTVRKFLGEITKTLRVDDLQVCFTFLRETNQAEFLFSESIKDFIEEIYRRATSLHAVNQVIESGQNGHDRRLKEKQQRLDLEHWLSVDAHTMAAQKFTPYIKLHDEPGLFISAWISLKSTVQRLRSLMQEPD